MISDWSLKNRCDTYFKTDYPYQSNQNAKLTSTRFKTEQKQNIPEKIATEGDVFLKKKNYYLRC